jgi:peptidoglycan/LPS O-acetylase OafA/YrhL
VVATCVIREDHILSPILSWRPLAYIGSISYGMYLLHGMAYAVVRKAGFIPARSVAEFVTATLVTIAVAALSYRLFESRFLRLKDRFEPKRSAEPAAEQPRVSAAKA